MIEEEQIKQLQIEIQQLAAELSASKEKLQQLHQRLMRLQSKEGTGIALNVAEQPTASQNFSLENFIGLRLIHLVGIIVLVIGLSIGVKYAIDKELISALSRIILAYLAGGILYFLSWKLKEKYIGFSAILFSGAMASLYFTSYAAFVYYNMFSFGVAFFMMIAFTIFAAYNALKYNRQEIAILGLVGAYAIPFLISKNADRPDLFFTYISIINIAVVFLSFKKRWRLVMYITQIITWILFIGWGMTQFEPEQKWLAIICISFFFLLFVFYVVANKIFRSEPLHVREMQQLILNNVAAYVASLIIFAPSFSTAEIGPISIFFAITTLLQAGLLFYFFPKEKYTKKMLALLSLVLLMVFIANEWEGLSVTLLWLFSAVLLFAWGFLSKAVWLRMASIVLMGTTLLKLIVVDSLRFTTIQKIISYLTLGILLMVIGFFYQKFRQKLFGD